MKLNYIKVKKGKLIWKQIEKRNGKVFMRMRQQSILKTI